jgi:myo-inositol-1(or 4)-monophosphatase
MAEDEILRALFQIDGVRVLSEEAGEVGDPRGETLAVLDPVDGSGNFARGIQFYCTSIAIAKGDSLDDVSLGLVRNLVTGDVYLAEKGKGATRNGRPIRTSKTGNPSDSVVGIDLSRGGPALVARLARLVSGVQRQVHYGAIALELCMVAEGSIDAFVDLRRKLRVTDVAAAYLILNEAGATVTAEDGVPLKTPLDLRSRLNLVASANRGLHDKILELCRGAAARRV